MARKIDLDSPENDPVRLLRLYNMYNSVPEDLDDQMRVIKLFHDNLRVGPDHPEEPASEERTPAFLPVYDVKPRRAYRVAQRLVDKAYRFVANLSPTELKILERLDRLRQGLPESLDSICMAAENIKQMDPSIEHELARQYVS